MSRNKNVARKIVAHIISPGLTVADDDVIGNDGGGKEKWGVQVADNSKDMQL